MKGFLKRSLSWLVITALIITTSAIAMTVYATDGVPTILENFESGFGTDISTWMVDGTASYKIDKTTNISGLQSLQMKNTTTSGCYVSKALATPVSGSLVVRFRRSGTAENGMFRINVNGVGTLAHGDFVDIGTTVKFYDLDGNDVTPTDGSEFSPIGVWDAINVPVGFDGYIFVPNTNNININRINLGIAHGSNNGGDYIATVDAISTYTGDNDTSYKSIVNELNKDDPSVYDPTKPQHVNIVDNFETGFGTDIATWMVDGTASYKLDTTTNIAGVKSLQLKTTTVAGCYFSKTLAAPITGSIAVRIKRSGTATSGMFRINANGVGTLAHADYADLGTTVKFYDLSGNDVTPADGSEFSPIGVWDAINIPVGFDGYIFVPNTNNVAINRINLGIGHGSTGGGDFIATIDNIITYTENTPAEYSRIVTELNKDIPQGFDPTKPVNVNIIDNYETGIGTDYASWMVSGAATYKLETKTPLAGKLSLQLKNTDVSGCYVSKTLAAPITGSIALRFKQSGAATSGMFRINANGVGTLAHADFVDLGTAVKFYDLSGNDVTPADGADFSPIGVWDAINVPVGFDGYIFVPNTNNVTIDRINLGIAHGSASGGDYIATIDNIVTYTENNPAEYSRIVTELNKDIAIIDDGSSSTASGIKGVPASTKDNLMSDDFSGVTLNSNKWVEGGYNKDGIVDGVVATTSISDNVTITNDNGALFSKYGQIATTEKPAFLSAKIVTPTAANCGIGLFYDNNNFYNIYYDSANQKWVGYGKAAGTVIAAQDLKTTYTFTAAGAEVGFLYNGATITTYIGGAKSKDQPSIPGNWDSSKQYKLVLFDKGTFDTSYVAGGIFTYTGTDTTMSDDFESGNLDKWDIINAGYSVDAAGTGKPGTIKPAIVLGQLVVEGIGDSAEGSNWGGISLVTKAKQVATEANPVTFEVNRVSEEVTSLAGGATAAGLGIYVDENTRFQIVHNSHNPLVWQWNGKIDGTNIPAGEVYSGSASISANYRFKIIFNGKNIKFFANDIQATEIPFNIEGQDVKAALLASSSNPGVAIKIVYDNFVTTGLVANLASTAEAEAEKITSIDQPIRNASIITIPQSAPGFINTVYSSNPSGYIDSAGSIIKRDANSDIDVKVVLQVYDQRNNLSAQTEELTVKILKSYNSGIIMDEITAGTLPRMTTAGIQNPYIDEKTLRLPKVYTAPLTKTNVVRYPILPDGFSCNIISSSNTDIVALDSSIAPPNSETNVTLKIEISKDGTDQKTQKDFVVVVPKKSGSQGLQDYQDAKKGMFVHYAGGVLYADGTKATGEELANGFDVPGFVASAKKWEMDYIMLTVWHGDTITLYPSEVMQKYATSSKRYTDRDVITDLLDEIDRVNKADGTHIKLYLYTHPITGGFFDASTKINVGWPTTSQGNYPTWNWDEYDYNLYNTFEEELYGELVSRYTNRANGKQGITGLYLDEGSPQGDSDYVVDYARIRNACKLADTNILLIQNNYNNLYAQDVFNNEIAVYTGYGNSFNSVNGDMWESNKIATSIVTGSKWSPDVPASNTNPFNKNLYNVKNMFRFTVLNASMNPNGGGSAWAFGNYAINGSNTQLWETGTDELYTALAIEYKKNEESLYGTVPSNAYVTENAGGVTSLTRISMGTNSWGVATDSKDGNTTYVHVMFAPETNKLRIATPANGVTFSSASILGESTGVILQKNSAGYTIILPDGYAWSPIDTVIKLTHGSDANLDVDDTAIGDGGDIDVINNVVVFRDGYAYVKPGTTYNDMFDFVAASGKVATFMDTEGIDITELNSPAEENMTIRVWYGDIYTDYTIRVLDQTNNQNSNDDTNGNVDTSDKTGQTIPYVILLTACLLAIVVLGRRKNFIKE